MDFCHIGFFIFFYFIFEKGLIILLLCAMIGFA